MWMLCHYCFKKSLVWTAVIWLLTSLYCTADGCLDDPCLHGGTCTEQNGQIKCLCLPTYGGDFCQTGKWTDKYIAPNSTGYVLLDWSSSLWSIFSDLEHCEVGWDKFQGFCYRHFGRRLSWEVAEQHCRMLGAHLVSIMSPEEQNFINSEILSVSL